ncbi:RNA polymerase sigma factor [Pedobacter sp. P26]|uniref:RNA polymerase sigma factor n=1 Tax=Pedobacter sp. P26 TaxID=3423956 RepID=UPI003D6650A5
MSKLTREKEQELLSRLQLDDEEAFTALFYSYKNKLYGFIFGITGSSEVAKDILQDVFLKIWNMRHRSHEVENFNALVYRMAKNAALDQLKRVSRESIALSGLCLLSDEHMSIDPFEDMKATEIQLKYERALKKLPKQQRMVYELRHIEGVEYSEIAKKLNLSVATIRSHFRNALNTLKASIFLHLFILFLSSK